MYCSGCGAQIDDKASVCVHCGQAVAKKSEKDSGSALWWWLGFLVPIAGLLIWIFCHDTTPKRAKKAGVGAIVGTIVSVILVILFYVLYFVLFFFMFSDMTGLVHSYI